MRLTLTQKERFGQGATQMSQVVGLAIFMRYFLAASTCVMESFAIKLVFLVDDLTFLPSYK